MTQAAERLKADLEGLNPDDRAELASFLLQSLGDTNAECRDVEAVWDAEAARRAEEIRQGNVMGKPADQVFAEIRAKHK